MTGQLLSSEAQVRERIEALHQESFGWALCCCEHDTCAAEEILQITYWRILDGRARYGGQAAFKTWLFGVIRMVAREQRRLTWLRWFRFGPLEEAVEQAAHGANPADTAMQDERCAAVQVALKLLPARQHEVLLLVFHHDLSLDEAAAVMGVSAGSARTHYERGKQRLRGLLKGTFATL
jgi:RNA polymerase sigma factor (sigma-70 family)